MENICTIPYAIFGILILRNQSVKIRLKKKKMTVVTIQFSSQPIYPTSLLFSRQYFIIQCTKRRKKKSKQKKWPLRLPIHSTFPLLYNMTVLWTCPSARILHTHCPKELKGNREKKKGEDFHSSCCCCQKLSYKPIRKTRGHRKTRHSILHRFCFWLSSPEMPPAHSNNQTCLSGLKLLSKGTTKRSFWLKPQKNSL